jgi:hypothetical protein
MEDEELVKVNKVAPSQLAALVSLSCNRANDRFGSSVVP